MKITAIEPLICHAYRTNWVFVRVDTDEGLTGWGESTLEYREMAVVGAIADLAREVVGRDAGAIGALVHDVYRDGYWRGGPVLMSALSGIEMALWDLKGKALGVAAYDLLGGKVRDRIRCYANGWFAPARTPQEFAHKAAEAVGQGYAALKWDPFGSAYRSITRAELRAAVAVVEAVRQAVGDQVELLIEAHGRFDVPTALRVAAALREFDILWLEEPLPPDNLDALAHLRRRCPVRIAAGERLYSRYELRAFLAKGCADFVQPDISHVGGLREMVAMAQMCEVHHVAFCPHNPSGPVANAATLALAALCPNFEYLEFMSSDVPWRRDICVESLRLTQGAVEIPAGVGLGVQIDERAVASHPFEPVRLRHYRGTLTDIRPSGSVWTAGG